MTYLRNRKKNKLPKVKISFTNSNVIRNLNEIARSQKVDLNTKEVVKSGIKRNLQGRVIYRENTFVVRQVPKSKNRTSLLVKKNNDIYRVIQVNRKHEEREPEGGLEPVSSFTNCKLIVGATNKHWRKIQGRVRNRKNNFVVRQATKPKNRTILPVKRNKKFSNKSKYSQK